MRFLLTWQWHPIRLVLPLSLMIVSCSMIGGFWWFEMQREMHDIEQQAIRDQGREMQHLAAQMQRLLRRDNMQNLVNELDDYSSKPDLQFILLSSPDGQVIASSRHDWVGRMTDTLGIPDLHQEQRQNRLESYDPVSLSEDGMTIRTHYPVAFPPSTGSLRGQRIGHLSSHFDLRFAKQTASHRIEHWVGLFAALVTLVAFIVWLISRYAITRRMNRIIAAAHRVSCGDFNVHTRLTGRDELAQISAAFDDMIDKLGGETTRLKQLSRAVENMNEGMLITDARGNIEYVNSAFTRITGYAAEEAIGKNPRMLKSGKHPPEFYKAFWGRISHGKVWKGRMTDRKKDGALYLAKVSVAPLLDAEGSITHYVGVQEDISEQQKMEMQLLQAQKMESLGTLVGGIAHDFNNILAGMVGNLYMARKRAKDMPEISRKLERVEQLSFRAADMIKQLLAFARKDMVQFKTIDLVPFIKEAYKLSRMGIPEDISCTSDVAAGPMLVECDASQVQQMMMNLMSNARDSLDGVHAPEIAMNLMRYEPDAPFKREHPESVASAYALLSIEDNGCGIPEKVIDHIFEPFFTTKGVGQGSGLGLSMVFGAMQRHEGVIEVKSEPGRGSKFRLYFPLLGEQTGHPAPDDEVAWRGNGERLLVADDEIIVRETISEMLRIDNFKVDVADDGLDAVEQFSQNPHAYAAIILDVVMPRMGGMDAAHRMREIRPDIPIIFATGYDRDHVLHGVEGMNGIASLSKPLHSSTLRQTLSELLHLNSDKTKD